ncbi:MAG: hypothetical protein HY000_27500, partial [Planctomycetes bacterium]|nr:hypothetical protein [Planctomycetota bacterium]
MGRLHGAGIGKAIEVLEERCLLSVEFRTIDGTGNNLDHPDWVSTGIQLLRRGPAAYGDGVSSPAGADRPGAREISNAVAEQPEDEVKNERMLSDFIYSWGQFLDHDLDLTRRATGSLCPPETHVPCEFNIPVPTGDLSFDPTGTGTQVIPLNRSEYDPVTGTGAGNPRQQI